MLIKYQQQTGQTLSLQVRRILSAINSHLCLQVDYYFVFDLAHGIYVSKTQMPNCNRVKSTCDGLNFFLKCLLMIITLKWKIYFNFSFCIKVYQCAKFLKGTSTPITSNQFDSFEITVVIYSQNGKEAIFEREKSKIISRKVHGVSDPISYIINWRIFAFAIQTHFLHISVNEKYSVSID